MLLLLPTIVSRHSRTATMKNFTLQIVDLQAHVYADIAYTSVYADVSNNTVRQTLQVNGQANNCSSLFGCVSASASASASASVSLTH